MARNDPIHCIATQVEELTTIVGHNEERHCALTVSKRGLASQVCFLRNEMSEISMRVGPDPSEYGNIEDDHTLDQARCDPAY